MTISRHLRDIGHLPTGSVVRFTTAYLPSSGTAQSLSAFFNAAVPSFVEGQAEVIVLVVVGNALLGQELRRHDSIESLIGSGKKIYFTSEVSYWAIHVLPSSQTQCDW